MATLLSEELCQLCQFYIAKKNRIIQNLQHKFLNVGSTTPPPLSLNNLEQKQMFWSGGVPKSSPRQCATSLTGRHHFVNTASTRCQRPVNTSSMPLPCNPQHNPSTNHPINTSSTPCQQPVNATHCIPYQHILNTLPVLLPGNYFNYISAFELNCRV